MIYMGPIADAHQHFWDLDANYHPWLADEPPIPFRYGDYRAIRKNYLPTDYFHDAAGFDVVATVYVETEWDPADPVGETRFVEALRLNAGFPTAMVAQAWLDRGDAAAVLDAQASHSFVRSIRHKPRANVSPADASPGGTTDSQWRAGFAELGRRGLRFDLQTPWWHLAEAARLACDFPDTPIILNHTGLPSDRSAEGIAGWMRAMTEFAACPNTSVKISGIGQAGRPWTVDANRDIVRAAIDLFGVQRAMFASNFPVDSLCATYREIFDGFAAIVEHFTPAEQRALFHDNAVRIYALE